ncbi:hypothetical protein RJ55_04805 [Drechmeria coniospora]|nr:hypothetical protein RJ55_04805 [Drechmeria coniospora]
MRTDEEVRKEPKPNPISAITPIVVFICVPLFIFSLPLLSLRSLALSYLLSPSYSLLSPATSRTLYYGYAHTYNITLQRAIIWPYPFFYSTMRVIAIFVAVLAAVQAAPLAMPEPTISKVQQPCTTSKPENNCNNQFSPFIRFAKI